MQALRRRRRPVTGQVLADEMGISLRSLYRDIDTLKGMGAAIDCAVGLGLHADFATAVRSMTRVSRTFEPDRRNADLYDALYEQVYSRMYRRLAPLYRRLRDITGYPSRD